MRPRTKALLIGVGLGALIGVMVAQRTMGRHRRDLFSPRPLRRLAALGYLNGHPSVEGVRLLRDYLAWEAQPLLRRRAASIVRRMEERLG